MIGRAPLAALAVGMIVASVLVACSSRPESTSTPTAALSVASPLARPAAVTPTTPAATPSPRPVPGTPFPLDFSPVDVQRVPADAPDPAGPLIYDTRDATLSRLTRMLPFLLGRLGDDLLVRESDPGFGGGAIVRFDLASGEATRILPPVSLNVLVFAWPDADRILVWLDGQPAQAVDTAKPWPAGVYEVDLLHRAITFVDPALPGVVLAGGRVLLEPYAGRTQYRVIDLTTGESRPLDGALAADTHLGNGEVAASPIDARVAAGTTDGRLAVIDVPGPGSAGTATASLFLDPGDVVRVPRWSPDGRFIAVQRGEPGTPDASMPQTWIVDTAGGGTRGPFGGVSPVGWSPDGVTLLVVADQCRAGGWRLETIDARTGAAPRPIPTDLHGFWFESWAPDGRRILAGGVGQGVYVIDVATGASERLDAFGTGARSAFPIGLDWTADGRWIVGIRGPRPRPVWVVTSARGRWRSVARLVAAAAAAGVLLAGCTSSRPAVPSATATRATTVATVSPATPAVTPTLAPAASGTAVVSPEPPYVRTFAKGETVDVAPAVLFIDPVSGTTTAWVVPGAQGDFGVAPSGAYIVYRVADGYRVLRTDDGSVHAIGATSLPVEYGPGEVGFIAPVAGGDLVTAFDGHGDVLADLWRAARGRAFAASWSRDGAAIAVAQEVTDARVNLGIAPDLAHWAPVDRHFDVTPDTEHDLSLAWSPDGSRLALVTGQAVRVLDRHGADLWSDEGQFWGNPRWSPDGRYLYVDDMPRSGADVAYIYAADGTALFRFVAPDYAGGCGGDPWRADGGEFDFGHYRVSVDGTFGEGGQPAGRLQGPDAYGVLIPASAGWHVPQYTAGARPSVVTRLDDSRAVVTVPAGAGRDGCAEAWRPGVGTARVNRPPYAPLR